MVTLRVQAAARANSADALDVSRTIQRCTISSLGCLLAVIARNVFINFRLIWIPEILYCLLKEGSMLQHIVEPLGIPALRCRLGNGNVCPQCNEQKETGQNLAEHWASLRHRAASA